jgi:hypothetical protein
VTAESYLQHAEHYNRIIMAAQQQLGPQHGGHQGEGPNGGFRPQRWNAEGSELDDGDVDEGGPGSGMDARGGGESRGGRERGQHGGNGADPASHDANGADQPETQAADDTAPDPVS